MRGSGNIGHGHHISSEQDRQCILQTHIRYHGLDDLSPHLCILQLNDEALLLADNLRFDCLFSRALVQFRQEVQVLSHGVASVCPGRIRTPPAGLRILLCLLIIN